MKNEVEVINKDRASLVITDDYLGTEASPKSYICPYSFSFTSYILILPALVD